MLKTNFYRFASLFLFLNLITLCLSAQETMSAGYVVKAGDTLTGQLIEQERDKEQLRCLFIDSNGNKQEYGPETISAWAVENGRHYRAVPVLEQGISQKRFAQVLLDGFADLLLFVDNDGVNRFLFSDSLGVIQEVNDPKAPNDSGKAKGRLIFLLGNEDNIRKVVYKQPFTKDGVLKMIEAYNQQNQAGNPGNRFEDKERGMTLNFSIHAGYSLSKIQFPETKHNNLGSQYGYSSAPVFAVAADLSFAGLSKQFGLRLGLNYQTHQYSNAETRIELSSIRLPLHLVFRPLKKSNSLQLFAGVFGDKKLSIAQEGVFLAEPYKSLVITPERLIEFPEKSLGYGLSVGIDYLFPLGKKQKLMVSASYALAWSNMTFRYYASFKDFNIHELNFKSNLAVRQYTSEDAKYTTWASTTINHQVSYIDFKLGFLF
ncbi:MAG: PorT family protein [Bacteroidales bacterium]|nr:PorT family protein [Bacteroidales bacterium]